MPGGRPDVRRVLYMATLSAMRCGADGIRPFYERLHASGKSAKPAIVAATRKFIIVFNAVLRDGTTWQPA